MFAEPEQGAPLARASTSIPVYGSPLPVEVRREEGMGRYGGGEAIGEAHGVWYWGCRLPACVFLTRLILDVSYDAHRRQTNLIRRSPR